MKRIAALILLSTLLNGCSGINSQFDCPMKSGIRCESIDSVNARVDRGEIGSGATTLSSRLVQPITCKAPTCSRFIPFRNGEPLRYGETVMRVWVAPFEDKEGNYHQESDIFTITKPGSWIGTPLKEMDVNGEYKHA
jgi:conjugal transfer pilus assembly protein TraV